MLKITSDDIFSSRMQLGCYTQKAKDLLDEAIKDAPFSTRDAIKKSFSTSSTFTSVTDQFELCINWSHIMSNSAFDDHDGIILKNFCEIFIDYLEFTDPYSVDMQCLATVLFRGTSLWNGKLERLCSTEDVTEEKIAEIQGMPPNPLLQGLMKSYLTSFEKIKDKERDLLFSKESNSDAVDSITIERTFKEKLSYANKIKDLFNSRKPA